MPRRKDPEITQYTLQNGQTYFRLKTYVGTNPETGKPIKVTRSKLKSRKEAELLRNKLKAQGPAAVANKLEISSKRKTVEEVYNIWLDNMKLEVRGSTLSRFKDTWRNQTQPEFGNNYIDEISPDHIQNYVNSLASKYTTYKSIANQLHRLIRYAIFRHWCENDPFDFVLMPKRSAKQKRDTSHNYYELDELKHFLEVAKDYNLMKYTFFLTVASLGCRRGEALALKWSDIDFDRKTVMIQRTVTIGHHVAVGRTCRIHVKGLCDVVRIHSPIFLCNIPHLKKHNGKTLYRVSLKADAGILPMAVYDFFIDVFIGQIDTARECGVSVNDRDFPVISVILFGGKGGADLGKGFAFDPHFLKFFCIIVGKKDQGTHAVIHEANLYPFLCLLHEDIQNRIPYFPICHNEIFHENKCFCLFQRFQKIRKHLISQRIIFHLRIFINGIAAVMIHIMYHGCGLGTFELQLFFDLWILRQIRSGILNQFSMAPIDQFGAW